MLVRRESSSGSGDARSRAAAYGGGGGGAQGGYSGGGGGYGGGRVLSLNYRYFLEGENLVLVPIKGTIFAKCRCTISFLKCSKDFYENKYRYINEIFKTRQYLFTAVIEFFFQNFPFEQMF
jgi:hypothetical protein